MTALRDTALQRIQQRTAKVVLVGQGYVGLPVAMRAVEVGFPVVGFELDDRGRFMRAWCEKEFEAKGIRFSPVQANMQFNPRKGTVRGLHLQIAECMAAW